MTAQSAGLVPPELPEPDFGCGDCTNGEWAYTADQMREYGRQCALAAPAADGVKLGCGGLIPFAVLPPPDGFVLVPREPTEEMVIAGFESEPDPVFSPPEEWDRYEAMTGCQQAAHRAERCYAAMLAAAPQAQGEG